VTGRARRQQRKRARVWRAQCRTTERLYSTPYRKPIGEVRGWFRVERICNVPAVFGHPLLVTTAINLGHPVVHTRPERHLRRQERARMRLSERRPP